MLVYFLLSNKVVGRQFYKFLPTKLFGGRLIQGVDERVRAILLTIGFLTLSVLDDPLRRRGLLTFRPREYSGRLCDDCSIALTLF